MLVELAKKAINAVFSDTSVPAEETRERLLELREELDSCLNTLDDL